MAQQVNVWSNVGVFVQSAPLGPAKTISAISKASPVVVTSNAHGFAVGDVLLLKLQGMKQMNYRMVRVTAQDTNSFTLAGLDSTLYDAFITGTAEEVILGAECSTLQDINSTGGEAAKILISTIHTDQDYQIPGNRSPLEMSFGSLWIPDDPALLALNGFDEIKSPGGVGIRFATGAWLYFYAYPSVSLAPQGSAGGPVTTPVGLSLRGRITSYPVV